MWGKIHPQKVMTVKIRRPEYTGCIEYRTHLCYSWWRVSLVICSRSDNTWGGDADGSWKGLVEITQQNFEECEENKQIHVTNMNIVC